MRARALRILDSPRAPYWLAGLACLLSLPALGVGLEVDDHVLLYGSHFSTHPFSLFSATPEDLARLRENGGFAWWASPRLDLAFFRPLSSLTHWIDFHLWPDAAWAMHLTNIALYGLSVWVAALAFRALMPSARLAAVAGLMFAIDEAHANAAGWISSRNTLLSGLFALLALLTHARSRAQQRPALRLASALCVGLALAAAEAGVAALAYLVAYALVFESGSWLERTRSVAPQLLVFSAWAVAYAALGCGMRGSSWYHELGDPLNLLREGSLDSPVWLFSLFGPSIVGYGAALTPNAVRLTALCLVVPVLVGLLFGLPRSRENRFFGLALLFCFPALLTTIPQERVTFAATFAAFGLIASLLAATRDSPRRALRWYRHGTVTVHFALAPLIFMVNLDTAKPVERGARAIARAVPKALPVDVVLVDVPVELLTMYAAVIAFPAVDPSAQLGIRALYAGGSALVAERTAPDTLEIRSELGWGSKPIERIFCAKRDLPQAGSERALAAMHVSVLETNREGSPTRVRFRFPTPLESPERQWLVWRGRGPTPWQPPALGQRVALPALSIASAL